MFKKTWVWIKTHPLYIVLGVGGLILLWLMLRGGGGGGGGGTVIQAQGSAGPSEALQAAQISAGIQSQNIEAQKELGHEQIAASLYASELGYQSKDYETMVNASVATSGIQAQENIQMAGIASQVQLADITNETTREQIHANVDMSAIAADTYKMLAGYQASEVIQSYQTQEHITAINAAQNTQLAQISADQATTIAKTQAGVAKKKSSNSLLGGIVGGVLSIFSDARLKTDIQPVGCDASGRQWYDYRYVWDAPATVRRGVLAQEILQSDPDAVTVRPLGFLMVNYGKLH